MTVSEEQVTVALARQLSEDGWRIISVHPPEGQGPFVIPREASRNAIERASYHPDVVAFRSDGALGPRIILAEVKVNRSELESDWAKMLELSQSRDSLLFALFRCQRNPSTANDGIDYEAVKDLGNSKLPVEFASACSGPAEVSLAAPSDLFQTAGEMTGFRCWHFEFTLGSP